MREEFEGWRGVVLTSQIELGKSYRAEGEQKTPLSQWAISAALPAI